MTPAEQKHFDKYEALAQKIGVTQLQTMVPFSPDEVRMALGRGDVHLNSLPLRRWDAVHGWLRVILPADIRIWSLCETVCVLKHVARYHYGIT